MTTGFIVARPRRAAGGHRYNAAVVAHWPGPPPDVVELDGPWPAGDPASRDALAAALARHPVTLLDGLVGAAQPDLVEAAQAAGRRVVLLVHLPLVHESPGLDALEHRTVRVAWRVVATSRLAAGELASRHRRADVVVAPPGVVLGPVAEPHEPPHLISVGVVGRLKNQLTFVRALASLTDLPWRATIVGPVGDAAYAAEVLHAAPPGRVAFAGELNGADLHAAFTGADLLVHPAVVETWGMVVTEALACGVPAIVGAGTGAEEALASGTRGVPLPGTSVDPRDPDALADVLRRWLTDPRLRQGWRRRALAARPGLGTWRDTATVLAATLAAR